MEREKEDRQADSSYRPIGMSAYGFLKSRCLQCGERTALSFYGKEISFSQLFERVENTAQALRKLGVGENDVVTVSLPAIPEAVYLFYAINKLAAVYCALDCRSTAQEIEKTVKQLKPKACFVPCFQLKQFRCVSKAPVISVDMTASVGGFTRFTAAFADFFTGRTFLKLRHSNIMGFSQFQKNYADEESLDAAKTGAHDLCGYFYTSGTTYGRKCVVLTNENFNSAVSQHIMGYADAKAGERMLNVMPLFTCYGLCLGLHLPLCLGMEVRLIPLFRGRDMGRLLTKAKPSYIITVPSHWDGLLKDRSFTGDISSLRGVLIGGDKGGKDFHKLLRERLDAGGSKARIMHGYGLTETASTATVSAWDSPAESVGKAACWTKIEIFDPETGQELPLGERGEICICGPSVCKGYLNDPLNTDLLLRKHDDGEIWLHSGDIGYLNEKGELFFCERIKRMYVRWDGTKVSPYAIEQALLSCPVVEECLVYPVEDRKHFHGCCAKALVVLTTEKYRAREYLEKFIQGNLGEHMRPETVEVVKRLPLTKLGKVDYFSQQEKTTPKKEE